MCRKILSGWSLVVGWGAGYISHSCWCVIPDIKVCKRTLKNPKKKHSKVVRYVANPFCFAKYIYRLRQLLPVRQITEHYLCHIPSKDQRWQPWLEIYYLQYWVYSCRRQARHQIPSITFISRSQWIIMAMPTKEQDISSAVTMEER